jgi:hypothetical protein
MPRSVQKNARDSTLKLVPRVQSTNDPLLTTKVKKNNQILFSLRSIRKQVEAGFLVPGIQEQFHPCLIKT